MEVHLFNSMAAGGRIKTDTPARFIVVADHAENMGQPFSVVDVLTATETPRLTKRACQEGAPLTKKQGVVPC
jgi:hypothetical protein